MKKSTLVPYLQALSLWLPRLLNNTSSFDVKNILIFLQLCEILDHTQLIAFVVRQVEVHRLIPLSLSDVSFCLRIKVPTTTLDDLKPYFG